MSQRVYLICEEIDDSLIKITVLKGRASASEFNQLLNLISELLNLDKQFILMIDASKMSLHNGNHEFKVMKWLIQNKLMITKNCLGLVIYSSRWKIKFLLKSIVSLLANITDVYVTQNLKDSELWIINKRKSSNEKQKEDSIKNDQ